MPHLHTDFYTIHTIINQVYGYAWFIVLPTHSYDLQWLSPYCWLLSVNAHNLHRVFKQIVTAGTLSDNVNI